MVRDLARNAVRFLTLRAVKLGITSIILKWKVTVRSNRTIPDSALRSVNKATYRQLIHPIKLGLTHTLE
jgi:hypothetical protein